MKNEVMKQEEFSKEQEETIREEIEDVQLTKDVVRETIKIENEDSIKYFTTEILKIVNQQYIMVWIDCTVNWRMFIIHQSFFVWIIFTECH